VAPLETLWPSEHQERPKYEFCTVGYFSLQIDWFKNPKPRYANSAVDKLGISLPQEELNSAEVQSRLEQWMQVVIYYSLRLLVAPTVESAILLDRLLFFEERGILKLI
jgi:hypothetical protein